MSKNDRQSQWHVLDFFQDDEGGSALTIFVNGTWFHIIADANKLARDTEAGAEYHKFLHDQGKASPEASGLEHEGTCSGGSSDSGVDVKGNEERSSKGNDSLQSSYDIEDTLKKWLVAPLLESMNDLAPGDSSKPRTLQDWYHGATRFCELVVSDDGTGIEALQLDATPELNDRMEQLIPKTDLPKYIGDRIDAPFFKASELDVLEESDQPPGTPYHPCKVQHRASNKTYFLKIVDNYQPQATKREIDILRRIKAAGLRHEFNVPFVEALAMFDDAGTTTAGKKYILGFLQTDIDDPTPLTYKLSAEVDQEARDAFAEEVSKIKDLLHEHKIIWGDAKADNFMVDANGRLWIIDFGGGYTEGWIDPEFNETREGDDTGTEKIVNALKDPVNNIQRPDDDDADIKTVNLPNEESKKRKRGDQKHDEGRLDLDEDENQKKPRIES